MNLLGVDTGGTFTDFVLLCAQGLRIHKVPSSPAAPEEAILRGMEELGLQELAAKGELVIVHGSTVATNAVLEGKGARTAFVTNKGFADLLALGRQARADLYNLTPERGGSPVPADLCVEVALRRDHLGMALEPLTDAALDALEHKLMRIKPESVAVSLLFSFVASEDEQRIAERLRAAGFNVCCSHEVLPEYREYERGIATWLNARLGPLVGRYLRALQSALSPAPLRVMQSNGGTLSGSQAAERAVNLLLSGPAGGLAAARHWAEQLGIERMLSFDMGGTSTDVALVTSPPTLTTEARIAGWPVAVPMVDIHTIGAGGGSIAGLDAGGALLVGPESAGAFPGPACYGKGGRCPTVTDANAVLGRLPAATRLGGDLELDLEAARAAVAILAASMQLDLEAAALGIVQIADERMARAVRQISVGRGLDPQGMTLCCFGGAGGLHVCSLADRLGISRALIPLHAGVLSAFGMLVAPMEVHRSRTHIRPLEGLSGAEVQQLLEPLERSARSELIAAGANAAALQVRACLELRYTGQSHTLTLHELEPQHAAAGFHQAHRNRFGHDLALPIELVTLRLSAQDPAPSIRLAPWAPAAVDPKPPCKVHGIKQPVPILDRTSLACHQRVEGPAIITEAGSTTWVAPGWSAQVHDQGQVLLERTQ